jgi:hypothetical protein
LIEGASGICCSQLLPDKRQIPSGDRSPGHAEYPRRSRQMPRAYLKIA